MTDFLNQADDPAAKREILAAALRRFTRQGIVGTSIRDIAHDSGFTNPALYKHFSSKDDLALRLFQRCYAWMTAELDTALDSADSDEERLDALLRRYLGMLDEQLDAVLYVNENLQRFWPEVPAELRDRTVVTIVREIVGTGVPGNPQNWVVAVVGLLSQTARMMHLGGLEGPAIERLDDFRAIVRGMLG